MTWMTGNLSNHTEPLHVFIITGNCEQNWTYFTENVKRFFVIVLLLSQLNDYEGLDLHGSFFADTLFLHVQKTFFFLL